MDETDKQIVLQSLDAVDLVGNQWGATKAEVLDQCEVHGLDRDAAKSILFSLCQKGEVQYPGGNRLSRRTRAEWALAKEKAITIKAEE